MAVPPEDSKTTPLGSAAAGGRMPSAPEVPPDPLLGTTLAGRYAIERKLGEGGMGSVYLATHVSLEKKVALKVLHGEFTRKPDLVERFLQEARAASRIRHENVIDITDFGSTPEGLVFFAMELLEGHDLHEEVARAKLEGRCLPWARSRDIFLQVCSALAAAHAQGIVHRDLKPENIYLVQWLGNPDFVKLLDFGIAKLTEVSEDGRKLTRTGMLFGTPEYMSPEQARGEPVDHRVDVYAMGCILHQLVTGRVPYEADNFMGILSMHLTDPVPVVEAQALEGVGAPAGIAAVIERALAKDRDARFASVDAMAAAVVAADRGEAAVEAAADAAPAEAPRRRRTQWTGSVKLPMDDPAPAPVPRKAPFALLVGAGGVALAGAVAYLLLRGGAPATAVADEPAAVALEQARITLTSEPSGAAVVDAQSGITLGTTPLTYEVPASAEPRRFRLVLDQHHDKVVELVPDRDRQLDLRLEPTRAGQGAALEAPAADDPPSPGRSTPSRPGRPSTDPKHASPGAAEPAPAAPAPAAPTPSTQPGEPASRPPAPVEPPAEPSDEPIQDPKLKDPFAE